MKSCVLALVLAVASSVPAWAGGDVQLYDASGTNADGSAHSGSVAIEPTSKDTCSITWKIAGATSTGFCMRSGSILSAAYEMGDVVGLVIYEIWEDESLHGVWTIEGRPGRGTEVLTPIE